MMTTNHEAAARAAQESLHRALDSLDLLRAWLAAWQRAPSATCLAEVTKRLATFVRDMRGAGFALDTAPPASPARFEEGRDWICTGTFDGFSCGSDADPGL